MHWNDHSRTVKSGDHALLGASTYNWLNYTPEKMAQVYRVKLASARGTVLHAWAATAIQMGLKQSKSKKTLNMYINDAIGYKMRPEQVLYYSQNCFGTADAISFKDNFLRIHDLKTGATPASLKQLEIYAALFCLEYDIRPGDIQIELRIYQNDDVLIGEPTAEVIAPIMDKIISFDKLIEQIKEEESL